MRCLGHADFSFEVKRSLWASDGAVLLVDATQGPQAQTFSHLQKALDRNLPLVAAINKACFASAHFDIAPAAANGLLAAASCPFSVLAILSRAVIRFFQPLEFGGVYIHLRLTWRSLMSKLPS